MTDRDDHWRQPRNLIMGAIACIIFGACIGTLFLRAAAEDRRDWIGERHHQIRQVRP